MKSIPNNVLLSFPPNILDIVKKLYGLDKPGEMTNAIEILNDWVQQQNHFIKKDFSKNYLEHTIINCKGSIERAKKHLDKLCTMKTLMPRFFKYSHIKEELFEVTKIAWFFIVPELTTDLYRIIVIQFKQTDFNSVVVSQFYNSIILMAEYLKANDYSTGYVLVFDYRNINTAELVTKFDLFDLQQLIPVLTVGYGARIKGLVWITKSKIIHGFIGLLKPLMSEKINSRIQVFKDLESFHNYIPKEILPFEYGGPEKSVEEMHNNLFDVLSSDEQVEYFKEMRNARTDETKRAVDVFNDQYTGMAGTFRNLSVD